MLPIITLVLGLMVATAVIAYWSDNLGKKLGKKRVTLFGLRPKQTATLITITSSMPIMLFTLAATLAVYKPLRDALTKYEKVRDEAVLAAQENRILQKSNEGLATKNAELSTQGSQLSKKIQESQKKINESQRALGSARADEAKATISAKTATQNAQNASRKAAEESRNAQLAQQSARQAEGRKRQAEQSAQFARQGEQSARSQERLAVQATTRAQEQLKARQVELKQAEGRLANLRTRLVSTQVQLNKTLVGVQRLSAQRDFQGKQILAQAKEILAQGKQILDQTSKVSELRAQVEGLRTQVEQSQVSLVSARTTLSEAQTKPSLVAAGETLAEKTIAPRQSPSEVQAELSSLMEEARVQARRLGESVGNLKLGIDATQRVHLDDRTEVVVEKALLTLLAQQLVSADTASSVRVIAARSHTISEPNIQVQLRAVDVRTAFTSGETLASANIDGRGGDAGIFKQLLNLANEGQRTAEKGGVQPPLSRDVPFYALHTNERIFEALRSIQALKSLANVRIVAAEDLSTANPLRVRFEVVPATRRST